MEYLAALMLVYVNGKGCGGLEFGFGFGGPKNVGTVLAQTTESPAAGVAARVKTVGFGLVHGMI
jgi:hypothetical protein